MPRHRLAEILLEPPAIPMPAARPIMMPTCNYTRGICSLTDCMMEDMPRDLLGGHIDVVLHG